MGLLPDTQNCGLHMRQEGRERFPCHRLQRKPLVSDPDMHHGTCVTHVPWCMSGSLTRGGGENVPDIPGACATRNFTYLARGPWFVACSIPGHYMKRCWIVVNWILRWNLNRNLQNFTLKTIHFNWPLQNVGYFIYRCRRYIFIYSYVS